MLIGERAPSRRRGLSAVRSDFFLECACQLAIAPPEGAVFEDAPAGVKAGRAGGFGCMVCVDRVGQAGELSRHGADILMSDLGDLLASP